jgi:uncharacterized protein YidB (DUF937 family)
MNTNPLLGQVLGGVLGQAMRRRGMGGLGGGTGGLGGGLGSVALGSVLGGLLGRRSLPGGRTGGGGRGALVMLLLPLAMRWVQSNGGMGAVLERFRKQGYGKQTQSWVDTGANQPLDERAVQQVVGGDELAQMAQRLGVPQEEVAQAFAEIMPEMVNQLSPEGRIPLEADEVLAEGREHLEREIQDVEFRETTTSK